MPTKKDEQKTLSQEEFIAKVAKSQKTTKVAVYNAINLFNMERLMF